MASNFAYMFVSILNRDMGLKVCGEVGSFPGFDKVMIRALSIYGGREEEEAASLHNWIKRGTSIFLNCL